MEDNLHDVVKLLLARMESHPEEFEDASPGADVLSSGDRWWKPLDRIMDWGSDAEKAAIREGLRKVKLKAAHEWAMDELCNGEERRRKQREEDEYERSLVQRHATAMQQQMYTQTSAMGSNYASQVSNSLQSSKEALALQALRNSQVPGLKYRPGPDTYEFHQQGFTTTYTRETLEDNPGLVATIKKALGI